MELNHQKKISVTFDLWETLILDTPEREEARSRMRYEGLYHALSSGGFNVRVEDFKRGYEQSAERLQTVWKENLETSTREQIQSIIELAIGKERQAIDVPAISDELVRAYVDPIFEYPPVLNEEAKATLEALRGRVNKLGLICNTGRTPGTALRQLLAKLGVLDFFDATVFSNEVGYRKPDRRIFEMAAKGLGARPSNLVHVGDNPEADIWGAKCAGLRALHFQRDVPEGFKHKPSSLFALSRFDRRIPDSEIKPDGRIHSLKEVLTYVDSGV